MAQKRRELRSIQDLTDKQKRFIDILVDNWGKITKTDALIESGYNTKTRESAMVLASKLTNPDINPHICRYLEKRVGEEKEKYEKDLAKQREIAVDSKNYCFIPFIFDYTNEDKLEIYQFIDFIHIKLNLVIHSSSQFSFLRQ